MLKQIGIAVALIIALGVGASAQVKSAGHAIVGEIKKVDREAGKLAVKTADGAGKAFKFTAKTTAHGVEEGGHATVHYTAAGGRKVVHALKRI